MGNDFWDPLNSRVPIAAEASKKAETFEKPLSSLCSSLPTFVYVPPGSTYFILDLLESCMTRDDVFNIIRAGIVTSLCTLSPVRIFGISIT